MIERSGRIVGPRRPSAVESVLVYGRDGYRWIRGRARQVLGWRDDGTLGPVQQAAGTSTPDPGDAGVTYTPPPASLPGSGTVGAIGTTAITQPFEGYRFDMPVASVMYHRPVFASGLSGDWLYRGVIQNLGILSGFATVGLTVATSTRIYGFGLFGQNYQRWRGTWDAAGTSFVSEDIDQSIFSRSHDALLIELEYDSGSGDIEARWLVDGFNAPPSLVETYTTTGTVASVGVGGQGTSGSAGGQLVSLLSAELS